MEKESIYIADGLRMPVSPYITQGFKVPVVCLLHKKTAMLYIRNHKIHELSVE